MATFHMNTDHTMIEVAKSLGADGQQLAIVDTLSEDNPFIEEGYWMEADDFNSHHILQVLTEPTGTDSRINYGVDWEIPTTRPVTEPIQGIEVYSKIDARLVSRQRDPQGYRAARDQLTVKGMQKTFHSRVLYGNNSTDPDRINGIQVRNNTLATATCSSMGGSSGGAQASIYCIKWGPEGMFFVYPRGGEGWIKTEDLGKQIVYDTQTVPKPYTALVSHYMINFGLVQADNRCNQRLANIDATHYFTLVGPPTGADILINRMSYFPGASLDNVVIYVTRREWSYMAQARNEKLNVNYGTSDAWGSPVLTFYTRPVRMCEQMLLTEAVVA